MDENVGLYIIRFDEPSLIDRERTTTGPAEFALSQNYPNPFNPQTTIRFNLPEAGRVNLSIYNSTGQMVETLIDQYRPAGQHSISWKIPEGAYSSGVYFYRLQAGSLQQLKKCVLLR